MSERIEWIDIAKGILIIFVIIGHIPLGGLRIENGAIASFYDFMPLYGCMYMSAFFIITGFCSNFNKKNIWELLIGDFKRLIFPACIITSIIKLLNSAIYQDSSIWTSYLRNIPYQGVIWFITVMVSSRFLYYFLRKIPSILIMGFILITCMVLGVVLYNTNVPNYVHFQHTLYFSFYIFLGQRLKTHYGSMVNNFKVCPFIYAILLFCGYVFNWHFPNISGGWIDFSYRSIPFQIILTIAGTGTLFFFSKKIVGIKILKYIGKESLAFYLLHGFILFNLMELTKNLHLCPNTRIEALFYHIIVATITIFICLMCIIVYNRLIKLLEQ